MIHVGAGLYLSFPLFHIFHETVGIPKASVLHGESISLELGKPRLSWWLSRYSSDSQLGGDFAPEGDI